MEKYRHCTDSFFSKFKLMMNGTFTSHRRLAAFLILCLLCFGVQESKAQFVPCPGVPTDTFDFTTNFSGTQISKSLTRAGSCCSDNNCLHFILLLDTFT